MHSTVATTAAAMALFGATALASPTAHWGGGWGHGWGGGWGSQHGGHKGKGASEPQVPFKFPLSNGFPNIQVPSAALTAIQKQAHGTLPNGPLPSKIQDLTATTFQLIAFNEIFEVAYFTSLLNNVTSGEYGIPNGAAKQIVVNALTAVQAQEELHALGANGVLAAANRTTIQPCEYVFPSSDFDTGIAVASLFTDLVLGTLQEAITNFGTDGDVGVLALVGGVIGQEGEQNGFYRNLGGKIPSALPFLSRAAAAYAFSALNQLFVVPGSCGNLEAIGLPIFKPLTVVTNGGNLAAKDQTVSFSVPKTSESDISSLSLVYINQQNLPVVEKVQNVKTQGDKVTFEATFPYEQFLMNGLTIAALTKSAGPFADVPSVADATVYGPGLIEIN